MRTEREVMERVSAWDDIFGFRREVLVIYGLTFASAASAGFLKPDATNDDGDWPERDEAKARRAAQEYLVFAIGKAHDHRGLSAGRSVDKLGEWLWLLEEDELLAEFDAAEYRPYGAPKLATLEEAWGAEHEYQDTEVWRRMRAGRLCDDDCTEC